MNRGALKLRKQLEERLGRRLSEQAWNFLCNRRYVDPVLGGEETIEELLEVARDFPEGAVDSPTVRRRATRRERREEIGPAYAEAISQAVAWKARQLMDVHAYRCKWLPNGVLKPNQISRWVTRQANQRRVDLPRAAQVARSQNQLVQTEPKFNLGSDALRAIAPSTIQALHLPYHEKSRAAFSGTIAVGKDGALGELAELAKHLSATLPWTETEALMFVLADEVPMIRRTSFRYRISGPFPLMSRITIDVDPTMTARELYAEYARFRLRFEKSHRIRSLSEKHSKLAVFAFAHIRQLTDAHSPLESAHRLMALWNSTHPTWKYIRLSWFNRDVRTALNRVLKRLGDDPLPV